VTTDDLRQAIVEEIGNIAPEADASAIGDDTDLREALDLDSMDIFNLVIALSQRFAVDIPDADAPRLTTLGSGAEYLRERLSASA
jgi:acyl carrier protein